MQNQTIQITITLFPPVSLWLFGAHVGVRRLLGDKHTANLAQLLVHLKGERKKNGHTSKDIQMENLSPKKWNKGLAKMAKEKLMISSNSWKLAYQSVNLQSSLLVHP